MWVKMAILASKMYYFGCNFRQLLWSNVGKTLQCKRENHCGLVSYSTLGFQTTEPVSSTRKKHFLPLNVLGTSACAGVLVPL